MEQLQPIIEGILFVSGDEVLTLKQLSETTAIDQNELQGKLDELIKLYKEDETRGIELVCFGGKYKFVTKALCHDYCQKLAEDDTNKTFSQAALETLAIIAYRQPITRVEIEEIRGVGCDMMIRKLLAKGLIEEAGRLETVGLPFTYRVSQLFMDTFSLSSLDELPKLPEYQSESTEGALF